jgi:hypothetical protein
MDTASRFRPERLPVPAQFWRTELAPRRLSRPSRGWARTTCPLHHGDNPTAFSVNLNTGAFCCHACGEKGDMVSFVMQRDHVDFKAAAVYLGAWDDSALTADVRDQIVERQQHRKRIDTAAEILNEMERAWRLDCRERIHLAEHCCNELSAAETWGEGDWLLASGGYDMLRRDLAIYTLLAFGAITDRVRYVLQTEHRGEMEASIRLAGGVRDEHGRWVEVLE